MDKASVARFFAKTRRKAKCLLWIGASAGGRKKRYGVFRLNHPRRQEYAHRIALVLHSGKQIPDGLYALHRCDTQLCIEGTHLYAGTQRQNMADYRAAGGNFVRTAKLTPAKVRRIRRLMRRMPTSDKVLAEHFGVSRPTITNIRNGKIWKNVTLRARKRESSSRCKKISSKSSLT